MRKSYLILLMLVAFALSASATKHTARYEFKPDGAGNPAFTSSYNNHLDYTSYTRVSTLKGFGESTDMDKKTMKVVKGFDNRFAFYDDGTQDHSWNRYYSTYLYNNTDQVNIFTILNLRAGDIVKIKVHDDRTTLAVKDRFIVDHSANAADNRPWTLWGPNGPNQQWGETTAYHEFIMQEDGDLDLACAPKMVLENVQIIYPFVEYNKNVDDWHARNSVTTPTFTINPNGEDHVALGTPGCDEVENRWMAWANPVVMYRGDIDGSNATVEYKDNKVTVSGFTGKGGAVVIMIERYMFVYTVPYLVSEGGKAWNFWQKELAVGRASEDGSQGPDKLSLQRHDIANGLCTWQANHQVQGGTVDVKFTRYWEWMNGQNAYFNEETAGLHFWDGSSGDKHYGYDNETEVEDGDGNRYITLHRGGGFDIPGLKAGDQVFIYVCHCDFDVQLDNNTNKAGVKLSVLNARDALNHLITTPLTCGGSIWGPSISNAKWGRQYYGALHFYADHDGDMSFQVDGNDPKGYIKLCFIRVYRNQDANGVDRKIITNTDEMVSNTGGYEILLRQNADGSFNASEKHTLELRTTNTISANQNFEVLECSGKLTKSMVEKWCTKEIRDRKTNPSILNILINTTDNTKDGYVDQPIYGAFLVRGMDMDHNNKYCVNYADRVIAVGTLQQMNYPYTWNFTHILDANKGNAGSMFVADASQADTHTYALGAPEREYAYGDSTRIWTQKNGNYEINNAAFSDGNRTWASGAQLYARGEYMEEAAGVGFATWNQAGSTGGSSRNGDIVITSGGVKIKPQHTYGKTRLFLPKLKEGMRVYLQGKRYVGGKSGFGVNYLTGKSDNPRVNNPWNTNRYHDNDGYDQDNKWSSKPLLADVIEGNTVHIIKGNEISESLYDNFLYNFSALEIEQGPKEEELGIDANLTVLATEANPVEVAQTSPSPVNNAAGLFQFHEKVGDNVYAYVNGASTLVQYKDENGNVVTEGLVNDEGKLVYDSDNVTLATDDNSYFRMLKLLGEGSSTYRVAKVSGLNSESTYDVTVVLKSGDSDVTRELKIYNGNWGGTEAAATMLATSKLMAKNVQLTGVSDLTIGSAYENIEIYAIYVKESNQTAVEKEVDFLAYIDMDEADFYGEATTNLTIYVSDVLIERMAVTKDKKELGAIGWASESRDYYVDHSLNEVFNGLPVKAYITKSTAAGSDGLINAVTITELQKPMQLSEQNQVVSDETDKYTGTGCIMFNTQDLVANESGVCDPRQRQADIYLFVPAIHDYMKDEFIKPQNGGNNTAFCGDACTNGNPNSEGDKTHENADEFNKINKMDGNLMMANLTGHTVDWSNPKTAKYTNYVLSYQFLGGDNVQHPTAEEIAAGDMTERFVRVAKGGATGKANTAYLRLPTKDVQPKDWVGDANLLILFDGEENTDPDGIEEINLTNTQSENENGTYSYYTLSGQKVNKPNKPGIYVRNGKKVYIK